MVQVMAWCHEATRQPLPEQMLIKFSDATGMWHHQVVADSNLKYVLEIKDVPKFKDVRT